MNIKHKVIQDFQFVTTDKKIIVLKANSILENYTYNTKGSVEPLKLEKELIENNSTFFKILDWREELHSFIKSNKIPQPAILAKKIAPFIEEMFVNGQSKSDVVVTDGKIQVNDEEIKFKESQLEGKSKRLDLLEKQILEEQQKLSEKELDFLRKEKNFTDKLRDLETDKTSELRFKKESDELQRRHIELLNKERDLFEKENELEKIKIREKRLKDDIEELELKLEEITQKEKIIKEKEIQLKNVNLDEVVLREINLDSLEKKVELKERHLKSELGELKSKEFFLLQKEKDLNEKEKDLNNKEEEINKKESDLNSEEINLIDLSNKLEKLEESLIIRESAPKLDIERFIELVDQKYKEGYFTRNPRHFVENLKILLSEYK